MAQTVVGSVAALAFVGSIALTGLGLLETRAPGYSWVAPGDAPRASVPSDAIGRPEPHASRARYDDAGIVPAAGFALRGTPLDRSRALECLTAAIYYEAANEPDDGQRAVAQVVLNRVRHAAFPATVCGVVYQGSDRKVCQFSFACDGAMLRIPAATAWRRAQRVAASALNGAVFAPVGLATHYHTHAVTPSWNRSLVMTGVHGAHFFHRWKGQWGTPGAFADRYRGGEPMPGPLPRPMPDRVIVMEPAAIPTSSAPDPAAVIDPADTLPGESQIHDRWQNSGQPIR
jgi:hypothetical protein